MSAVMATLVNGQAKAVKTPPLQQAPDRLDLRSLETPARNGKEICAFQQPVNVPCRWPLRDPAYLLKSPKRPPFFFSVATKVFWSSSFMPRRLVRSEMLRVSLALGANLDNGTPLFRDPTMVA